VETCEPDTGGCLDWSPPSACPEGLTCDAAQGRCLDRLVELRWAPNRESTVNAPGGGYAVSISGQPTALVPFVSGLTAPTALDARLPPGTYVVTIRAYSSLDAQGGGGGTLSEPSQPLVVNVP
jgi:hypothetical protein